MFGTLAIPSQNRKPQLKWIFTDNHLTGICADVDYQGSPHGIILPHGLDDAQRDLMLWAFEAGFAQGKHVGEDGAKHAMRQAIGIVS